ncbi:MAG: cytochrome c3 family protein [Calditrichaceae bacterium]
MRHFLIFVFILVYKLSAQLSPGDLSKVHADLEGVVNCTQCHESGRQLADEKCLDCHTLLDERIKNGKGYHARPENKVCENCHVEHQGRDFNLIYWKEGRDNFDHSLTGYTLEGGHKNIDCRKCHTEKNIKDPQKYIDKKKDLNQTYLGLSRDCLSCHRDEHRGQLGNTCLDCHVYNAWKPATKFNHDKTKYPLTGKHEEVDCIKCHGKISDDKYPDDTDYQKFTGLRYNSCLNCHRDVHNNRFGSNCTKCHNTSGWKNYTKSAFDHDQTRFPLKGRHAGLQCSECHTAGNKLKFSDFKNCGDCHTDYHQGQFRRTKSGGKCEGCHDVNGFTPALFTIEQHNKGDYPLEGSHLAVPCFQCHTKINTGTVRETMQFQFKSTRCKACHDNVHGSSIDKYENRVSAISGMNGCEHCHQVKSWAAVHFDHSQTDFKLEGKHKTTSCIDCHKKSEESDKIIFNTASKECRNCHKDQHVGQFAVAKGKNITLCDKCHTPDNWKAEKFDHDKDASFKLTGAHQTVKCNQCHKQVNENGMSFVRYKPLSSECKSCHGSTIN